MLTNNFKLKIVKFNIIYYGAVAYEDQTPATRLAEAATFKPAH